MRAFWIVSCGFLIACSGDPARDSGILDGDTGILDGDAGAGDGELGDAGLDDTATGDSGASSIDPARGILQFRVRHNLETDGCLAFGNCNLSFEDEQDPAAWASRIAPYSTQASLHFDRALPWTVFADAPPPSTSTVAFYDARIDPALLRYLDGHRAQFQMRERRYLAVSILGGLRDRVASLRSGMGEEIVLGEHCGAIDPGAELELPGGRRAPLLDTYGRFVAYLAAKLEPTDLALMVEVDLFHRNCPAAWDGLVASYRVLHARMRAELGGGVRLFATFTVFGLLDYDDERCKGRLAFVPCDQAAPPAPALDPPACFPIERRPLTDFERDGRLDVLALSHYPSGYGFATPARGAEDLAAYPADWDGTGPCWMHARLPEAIDPLDQIERLNWSGELGIAEWSARGAPVRFYIATTTSTVIMEVGATEGDQTWWTDRLLARAEAERFRFVNASFLEDYPPVGLWAAQRGVLEPDLFNLINTWAYSGLLDRDGHPKPGVTGRWMQR